MSMKMMNAAYLVDNAALLSLQEKQDGVEFHCFDMDSKVQTTEGHIGWDVLDKQPSSTLEESARVVALQKIPQLDGLAVAPVAPEMLEQVRGGRKVLWQMKKADETMVHITATGKKYHRAGCRTLKKSDTEVTLEEAKSMGLSPCGICNPPQ